MNTSSMSEQIRVSKELWKELNSMKEPGDSFEDVIHRLLEEGNDV